MSKLKSTLQWVLTKALAFLLCLVFLSLGLLFLGYGLASLAATVKGHEGKVLSVTDQVMGHPTACRYGGLYQAAVERDKNTFDKVYCLYPAWPGVCRPSPGDILKTYPAEKPWVGVVPVEGWGWFILGTLLVLSFIMMEFAFLSMTIK